jgi:hypothetical protein
MLEGDVQARACGPYSLGDRDIDRFEAGCMEAQRPPQVFACIRRQELQSAGKVNGGPAGLKDPDEDRLVVHGGGLVLSLLT